MKISIIIPVYKVEKYIVHCLQSVANQTMTESIECIIVDDKGNDNSIHLAENFIDSYQGNINFKIIYRESNGGLSAARNTGINAASGDYLYFLDSDDEITPNCLEIMYSLIERYGKIDLVQGSFYETEQEKQTVSPYSLPEYTNERRIIKSFLLRYDGYIIPAQSRLINREFLYNYKLFFKEGIIHEDNYWTFFLAKYVTKMCFSKERTYYHRYNPNSITGNVNSAKETLAYKTIIHDLCRQIDPFLAGTQKVYILNNLITALRGEFYESEKEKKKLIKNVYNISSTLEIQLLKFYLSQKEGFIKSKILHLLCRIYKFREL